MGFEKRNTAQLLETGEYLKDPVEAYARRSAQALAQAERFDMARELVEKTGRRITDKRMHLSPNERVVLPGALLHLAKGQTFADDAIARLLGEGKDLDEAAASTVREML